MRWNSTGYSILNLCEKLSVNYSYTGLEKSLLNMFEHLYSCPILRTSSLQCTHRTVRVMECLRTAGTPNSTPNSNHGLMVTWYTSCSIPASPLSSESSFNAFVEPICKGVFNVYMACDKYICKPTVNLHSDQASWPST